MDCQAPLDGAAMAPSDQAAPSTGSAQRQQAYIMLRSALLTIGLGLRQLCRALRLLL